MGTVMMDEAQANKVAQLVAKIDQLAVLPHVVFKVLEITASQESSPMDIERAIFIDPGFSSKVLIMANSAAFGLPRKVTSIKDAVMFLGFRTVRNIALTVGVFDLFVGKTDVESLRRRTWWRHSIDTAVCARWMARHAKGLSPDEAYTCGLLHLIGKTLLDRVGGEDYAKISMLESAGVPVVLAERRLYGCDHAVMGVEAARKWGLPTEIQSGINYMSLPDAEDPARVLRACTALATRIAENSKEGVAPNTDLILPTWAMDALGMTEEASEKLIVEGAAAIAAARLSMQ